MFVVLPAAALLLPLASSYLTGVDEAWLSFLESPPHAALQQAEALSSRAEALAATLDNVSLGEFDVVVSGGGNFDAFYLGVVMVRSAQAHFLKRAPCTDTRFSTQFMCHRCSTACTACSPKQ